MPRRSLDTSKMSFFDVDRRRGTITVQYSTVAVAGVGNPKIVLVARSSSWKMIDASAIYSTVLVESLSTLFLFPSDFACPV